MVRPLRAVTATGGERRSPVRASASAWLAEIGTRGLGVAGAIKVNGAAMVDDDASDRILFNAAAGWTLQHVPLILGVAAV
jgi:hypothetical protein